MPKLTKIYTRGGDDGSTGLGGGQRVPKHSLRIEAYGTVDELNSTIGVALAGGLAPEIERALGRIQNELFHLGSDLCFLDEDAKRIGIPRIEERHVAELEAMLDAMSEKLGPLENFILPGGSEGAARLHLARTICRRAERAATELAQEETIGAWVLRYLNRLSDALFVMARYENRHRGTSEVYWDSRA